MLSRQHLPLDSAWVPTFVGRAWFQHGGVPWYPLALIHAPARRRSIIATKACNLLQAFLFYLETTNMTTLTYEAFLDEVTTILTERYDLDDAAAIKLVVDAQAADYFTLHDDREELRTVEQADKEAVALYEQKQNRIKTQEKQQQRVRQKK